MGKSPTSQIPYNKKVGYPLQSYRRRTEYQKYNVDIKETTFDVTPGGEEEAATADVAATDYVSSAARHGFNKIKQVHTHCLKTKLLKTLFMDFIFIWFYFSIR